MNRGIKVGLAIAGSVVVGGGFVWWGLRSGPGPRSVTPPRVTPSSSSVASSLTPPATGPSSSPEAIQSPPVGTVAWAQALRRRLAQQWAGKAPPLWAAQNPQQSGAWIVLAPLVHHHALWWAYATKSDPLPTFSSIPASLSISSAQVSQLPPPVAGALRQAYDLMADQPWPLTHQLPAVQTTTVMSWEVTEANGVSGPPIGWRLVGLSAIPKSPGYAGSPGGINVVVDQPWTSHGASPEAAASGMEWLANGQLISSGAVEIAVRGQSLVPLQLSAAQTALVPSSVAAGILHPTS